MHAPAPASQLLDHLRRELAERRLRRHQLGASRVESRRTSLVLLDVAQRMGDHGVIGLAQLRQRQRVGCRAVEHEKYRAVRLEQLADAHASLFRPGIRAIARRVPLGVDAHQGLQRLRAHAGIVVGGELLRHGVILLASGAP